MFVCDYVRLLCNDFVCFVCELLCDVVCVVGVFVVPVCVVFA